MVSKTMQRVLGVAGLLTTTNCSVLNSRDVTYANAEAAYGQLQTWYNQSIGLWIPSTGWWNSANCLTVITDLAAIDSNVKSSVTGVLSNTYVKAQQYNLNMTKVQGTESQPFLPTCYYGDKWPHFPPAWLQHHGRPQARKTSGFLNDYYDDEGWWALAWIAAYDLTKDQQYLSQAEAIFNDMNAQQWAWFKGTGMINAQSTINDGLNQQTCKNNGGTVWSYNQGVVLGGLVELSKATKDTSYITTAQKIADAAIAALAPNGILQDPCEPDCGGDGTQFKGVFVRNLQKLYTASPKASYANFLDTNANSIWANDRQGNTLSVRWSSFVPPGNASTQSSAMDCLVASLAT
ncbi:hypothetical protein HII31_08310 [Pseudocercospora fuligena]|uniref:Glycoside hydrolase family 76 protein n=1 Tax=Pseudocercospora fuligena TaxID=685502 RepID=A0A8H6VH82_9PEZI|nr:hypothetical protein HII31_08310 [Pseudocercospora fuligena]